MAVQIQVRRDTAANWTSVNPTLAEGEIGLETDSGKFKIGNGDDAWVDITVYYESGFTLSDGDKGDITVSSSGLAWTINNDVVTFAKIQNISTSSILGRTTASSGDIEVLSASTVRTLLSINNVENTALSTWAGTTNITTLGTISTGTWSATVIADNKIASALTGKTYNGLTLTAEANGFTIAGGVTPKTLTVALDANVSGVNTGDQTITLTSDVTGSGTGSFATTIAANAVTLAKFQQIATASILGRTSGSTGNVEVLSVSDVRTLLSINNVENTALSTWAGTTNITIVGTVVTGTWSATTIAINKGGTGQTTAVAAFDALSPMTTLGDTIYGGASGTRTRLAGNTTSTKNFLSQTGNGSDSAAPAWSTVSKTDVGLSNVENTALSTWAGTANITTLGTIVTGTWTGTTIAIANGGTGQTSATAAFDALSPMTTLGDIIYGGASGTRTRLAGNTTVTKKFLTQTGDSVNSAAPGWETISSGDVPSLTGVYVRIAPTASSDNLVQPSANNVTMLALKASATLSADTSLFVVEKSDGADLFRVTYTHSGTSYLTDVRTVLRVNSNAAATATQFGSVTMDAYDGESTGVINTSSHVFSSGGDILTNGGFANSETPAGDGGYIWTYGGEAGISGAGGAGGFIDTHGGDGSDTFNGGLGGSIDTHGADETGSAEGGAGGNVHTYATNDFDGGNVYTYAGSAANGGSINTSGGTVVGGSIDLCNGGGSITLNGASGSIGFGVSATRTTLNGSGSAVTVTLPAITGTLASLAGSQTFAGAKTFNDTTLLLRNSGNTASLTFAANISTGRTVTFPDVAETVCVAPTSTTSTHPLFATTTAGAPAYRAMVVGDLPSTYLDTAVLLAGRSGGQTIIGGTAANDDLLLEPTSNGTKTTAYVRACSTGGSMIVGNSTLTGGWGFEANGGATNATALFYNATGSVNTKVKVRSSVASDGTMANAVFVVHNHGDTLVAGIRGDGVLFGVSVATTNNSSVSMTQAAFATMAGICLINSAATGIAWASGAYYGTVTTALTQVSDGVLGVGTTGTSGANSTNGTIACSVVRRNEATPTQFAANTNNLATTGYHQRISSDAARDLTGIVAITGGQLVLTNIGAFTITLKHDVTSTAANRFICPGAVDFLLTAGMTVIIVYDNTTQRWRVI